MKTPEEIKKGLKCCSKVEGCKNGCCPYYDLGSGSICIPAMAGDALAYIQQLETSYGQVAKALGCKENATADELVYTVMQISKTLANANEQLEMARAEREATNKNRIALMIELSETKRERDAAIKDIPCACGYCKNYLGGEHIPHCTVECRHISGINTGWQWRGVCPEAPKEE